MYEYLNIHLFQRGGISFLHNCFGEVKKSEIIHAEKRLGFKFPSELRQFYLEIGSGNLRGTKDTPNDYMFSGANEIIRPHLVANFVEGILLEDNEEGVYMSEDSFSDLSPGDIPVFEIGDGSSFMIMKPLNENPNAVWYAGIEKIEDSFSQFIYNLYHIGPAYYAETWADEYLASSKE